MTEYTKQQLEEQEALVMDDLMCMSQKELARIVIAQMTEEELMTYFDSYEDNDETNIQ